MLLGSDLVFFGVQLGFISRSVHARLKVSVCLHAIFTCNKMLILTSLRSKVYRLDTAECSANPSSIPTVNNPLPVVSVNRSLVNVLIFTNRLSSLSQVVTAGTLENNCGRSWSAVDKAAIRAGQF